MEGFHELLVASFVLFHSTWLTEESFDFREEVSIFDMVVVGKKCGYLLVVKQKVLGFLCRRLD